MPDLARAANEVRGLPDGALENEFTQPNGTRALGGVAQSTVWGPVVSRR
jgi:hypothetical protein